MAINEGLPAAAIIPQHPAAASDRVVVPHLAPRPLPGPRRPRAVRFPRWNLSRHRANFRSADAFVCSIQKSGRTWVRVFLTAYFDEWKKEFRPEARSSAAHAVPVLCYTHDLWEHTAKQRPGERLRGKWLIPPSDAREKPILLVARDPRDVMVSLFFHLTRRARTFHGDLPALIRDPALGVARVVAIMNRWLAEWLDADAEEDAEVASGVARPRLHLLRYEDAHRDPAGTFAAAVRFLMPTVALEEGAFGRALETSSFDNMRRLEAGAQGARGTEIVTETGLDREALRPADALDPDSFKVRRGKVGGYVEHFGPADLAFLNAALARLDGRYGYR